jgi:FtsP/CotA-like multicopper oxidase with cupredoxin domain
MTKLIALAALLLLLPLPVAAQQAAFRTDGAATASLAATTTSSRVQIQTAVPGAPNARIYNSGSVPVFVECGDITVVATVAAGLPVAPGTVEVLGCQKTHIAGITATGTATLYVTPGTGL